MGLTGQVAMGTPALKVLYNLPVEAPKARKTSPYLQRILNIKWDIRSYGYLSICLISHLFFRLTLAWGR